MRITCFGGGTGLPSLLSGLKKNPWIDVTAVVSMFDSGGSSGVLRDRYGILPPGDILKCLLALAEDEQGARKILLKRIKHESLPGHTGGNLLLYAFEKIYGSYPDAVAALAQILSVKGNVVPVSLDSSSLCARYEDGSEALCEVEVDRGMEAGKKIASMFLDPMVRAYEPAIDAIRSADAICVGPGSFYTSVLPNFLPEGIGEAVKTSDAPIIFVANLLTEGRGMSDATISSLVAKIESHIGRPVARVIANCAKPGDELTARYTCEGKYILPIGDAAALDSRVITAPIWTDREIARHDSEKLAALVYAAAGKLI
jgi:uncharacterized cofD-like protein